MSTQYAAPAFVFGLCGPLLGCNESQSIPLSPELIQPQLVRSQVRTVNSASGHMALQATPVQNIKDERISFAAISGVVTTGQVELYATRFTGEDLRVHARVTCLAVVGNDAWIGSRVTAFSVGGESRPGQIGVPVVFRVRDMGEGHDQADVSSLAFFNFRSGELAYCAARPAFPLLWENGGGNVQVVAG